MNLHLERTTSTNPHFAALVQHLDADLAQRDGAEHAFYAPFNAIANLQHVIVAYCNGVPAGCGAIKQVLPGVMEVKRMYTVPQSRGIGVATQILAELEYWARELGYSKCLLETGKRQPEAIALYTKCGYHITPNYGQYIGVENSVCFEKRLCIN